MAKHTLITWTDTDSFTFKDLFPVLRRVKYMTPSTHPPPCTLSYHHFFSIKADVLIFFFFLKKRSHSLKHHENNLYSGFSLCDERSRVLQTMSIKRRKKGGVGRGGLSKTTSRPNCKKPFENSDRFLCFSFHLSSFCHQLKALTRSFSRS